ncbi:MAG: hypothetical protein K0U29_06970 [Gammaproteobacteria bacterium]|nr:hypothetical protein [Gammaproteobacteria bacterium]
MPKSESLDIDQFARLGFEVSLPIIGGHDFSGYTPETDGARAQDSNFTRHIIIIKELRNLILNVMSEKWFQEDFGAALREPIPDKLMGAKLIIQKLTLGLLGIGNCGEQSYCVAARLLDLKKDTDGTVDFRVVRLGQKSIALDEQGGHMVVVVGATADLLKFDALPGDDVSTEWKDMPLYIVDGFFGYCGSVKEYFLQENIVSYLRHERNTQIVLRLEAHLLSVEKKAEFSGIAVNLHERLLGLLHEPDVSSLKISPVSSKGKPKHYQSNRELFSQRCEEIYERLIAYQEWPDAKKRLRTVLSATEARPRAGFDVKMIFSRKKDLCFIQTKDDRYVRELQAYLAGFNPAIVSIAQKEGVAGLFIKVGKQPIPIAEASMAVNMKMLAQASPSGAALFQRLLAASGQGAASLAASAGKPPGPS